MNLDHAIKRYVWDDKKGLTKDKPQEKYKDPMDVVRYTLVKEPRWIEPGANSLWQPGWSGSNY
jgi:hypothetical protein